MLTPQSLTVSTRAGSLTPELEHLLHKATRQPGGTAETICVTTSEHYAHRLRATISKTQTTPNPKSIML
jgi:hypothetical protein